MNIASKISELNGYAVAERTRLNDEQFAGARAELEELLQSALPPQYLVFVRDYGLYAVEATVKGQDMPVAVFLGLNPNYPDDPFNLVRAYQTYKDIIPNTTLPVAYDDYGNVFIIHLKTSAVFFFDHETQTVEAIADDFDSFLDLLELLSDDDLAE
ncbi:hypothetical protein EON83_25615 [bacterium]|nr:MAG: hypothetical protein EON83_25615 [bacterium]